MITRPFRFGPATLGLFALALAAGAHAQSSSASQGAAKQPPASSASRAAPSSTAGRPSSAAKGPLPDPALLDGSTQPAEKKPETGMIGDFELPGDENVRNGKVGGQQGGQPGGQQKPGGLQVDLPGIPTGGGQAGAPGQQSGLP